MIVRLGTKLKRIAVAGMMVLISTPSMAAFTDQLLVVYDSPSQALQHANPKALAAVQKALDRRVELVRFAGQGEIAVLKMSDKVAHAQARQLAAKAQQRLGQHVEPDYVNHPVLIPNDTYYTNQWHYYEPTGGISAEPAWDISTGSGSVVAVLDTGYRPHQDLVSNILPGFDMIQDNFVANDGNGRDSDAQDPGDYVSQDQCGYSHAARNSSWHGTHVSGTIAASTNNLSGVAGVAYDAKVLPVRVLGRCGGYSSDIADGIRWAAGLSVSGVPQNDTPAQVINMSLGGQYRCSSSSVYQNAINAARNAGATIVVAAGNANMDAAEFTPASCDGVITVAASNRYADRAYYSNYGSSVEIAAPGGDSAGYVLSTLNSGTTAPGNDNYAYYQGTSMSAPHVSGVAALLYAQNASLTPDQTGAALIDSARAFPSGSSCAGLCGAGIVDAKASLDAISTVTPPPPEEEDTPPATPIALDALFDSQTETVTFHWQDVENEDGYKAQREYFRQRGKSGSWQSLTDIATVGADVTSTTDQPTKSGRYRYRVAAFNATGDSGWSGWVEVEITLSGDSGGGGDKPCRGKKCG